MPVADVQNDLARRAALAALLPLLPLQSFLCGFMVALEHMKGWPDELREMAEQPPGRR